MFVTVIVRLYLVFTALFEIMQIVHITQVGATLTSPILRELVGGGRNAEERRGIDALWIGFLANLTLSRLFLAYDVTNTSLFGLVLAIHIAEALLFLRAVPILRWRKEVWAVPYSFLQAFFLFIAYIVTVL